MTFTIRRKNIEGAMSLGMIPKAAHPHINRVLESAPDVDSIEVSLKAFSKDSKDIDIGAGLKMKILSILLSGLKGE